MAKSQEIKNFAADIIVDIVMNQVVGSHSLANPVFQFTKGFQVGLNTAEFLHRHVNRNAIKRGMVAVIKFHDEAKREHYNRFAPPIRLESPRGGERISQSRNRLIA
jgi:hypothetical protein